MGADMSRVNTGDRVRLRGFQPMSTMEHYEGATGTVVNIEVNRNLGDVIFVQLNNNDPYNKTDKIIQTRRQYCEKE